jgi:hypothetical protein
MLSDTVVSFGSHTVHLSSVGLLIAALDRDIRAELSGIGPELRLSSRVDFSP